MRRLPARRSITSRASFSTLRCCETAGRLTGSSRGELADRTRPIGEALEDRSPGRVAKGGQPSSSVSQHEP